MKRCLHQFAWPSTVLSIIVPLALARGAFANGYNIDLGSSGSGGAPGSGFGAASGQGGHWNAIGSPAENETLLDITGANLGVTISSEGGFPDLTFDAASTTGNSQALLDDFQDTDDSVGPIVLTIEGLDPGQYQVFTYPIATDRSSVMSMF